MEETPEKNEPGVRPENGLRYADKVKSRLRVNQLSIDEGLALLLEARWRSSKGWRVGETPSGCS